MYIVSLAMADLIVGIIVMPISTIYIFTEEWIFGVAVCQIWIAVDYTASTASILNLFILSVDRYWSVTSPLRYLRKRTKKRALVMISIVWVISSLWIIPIVGWHHFAYDGIRTVPSNVCDTEYAKDSIFKVVTAFFNYFLPLAIMYSLYGKVFHEIRKRSALELGQQYPTATTPMTYNYDGDSQLGGSSSYSEPRIDTFTDPHSNRIEDANHPTTMKNSSLQKTKKVKLKSSKCLVLKSNKILLTTSSNGASDRSRLAQRCRVEYIYDENVLDQKTEKLERFYYEENIPLSSIRSMDAPNPNFCNDYLTNPSSSHHSSSSEERYQGTCNTGMKCNRKMLKCNNVYGLTNGIEKLRQTENILDTAMITNGNNENDSNNIAQSVCMIGDVTSRRISNMFNIKHRIKNFRQSSSLTREIKAARQLGVIMGAFTVCFLPYFTLFLVVAFCDSCVDTELMTAMTWIGYLNSTLNPFLYPLCNMNFRRKFRKMLRIDRNIKRRSRHAVDRNSLTMRYD
ncbi:histamine H1 receptor-like [Saccostrea echinata]|uniref:histamine H1 receptor-like n=1 Tax=Saccostrea echinata TaxID=191078 RepID=UPI002A81C544|nr:histamine H1 receptor-like [Saccostrea echinata]